MNSLSTRQKLVGAGVLLAMLPVVAVLQLGSAVLAARLASGLLAVAGLTWWALAGKKKAFRLPPRLTVVGRIGLSPRAGLALVEVDGSSWLVVHGDGYAQLRRTRPAPRSPRLVTDEIAFVDSLPPLGGAS
jgi:flagellar protein FliO/FliZ